MMLKRFNAYRVYSLYSIIQWNNMVGQFVHEHNMKLKDEVQTNTFLSY